MYFEWRVKFSPLRSSNTFFRSKGMQWAPGVRCRGGDRLVVTPHTVMTGDFVPERFHAMIDSVRPTPTFDRTERATDMTTGAPNILLVMSDQHRADMMGCAGDASALTPSLDALAAQGVRFSRVSCQGPLCMPSRASFMTERYVRDHGVYTNSSEIPPDSPTYAWALREAGYHTSLLGKAHLYLDEQLTVPHMDDMAGRLEALGFAEVFETGDKFIGKIPTRYTDYLAGRGLLDAYKQHIADRSYQGENEDGQNATKCVPMWDSTPTPDPARVLRRRLARPAGRRVDRALRPPGAVLPLRRVPRTARPLGRAGRGCAAVPGRRHLHALLDPAPRRSKGRAATARS